MAVIEEPQTLSVEEAALIVTPAAVGVIKNLLEQRNIPDHALRVFVTGGGCSGLQYGMSFEAEAQDYDAVVEKDGVRLLVDPTSLVYLKGATIDFVDSLIGGGFRIDNPNAVSQCGCGHSFKAENGEGAAEGGCSTCSSSY
ncbi:iron-sulfur cluster insertion protein ErpA [Phototrophicus methaneseepsis]|uniref:Iron-sulfur cluster insertion protein ErpA n=1 Tax=Phototrophicus methaneseepsis TaxID=2710758 RepID=A0A7S8IC67_9CHLR|nr:iron-sulfur cluster insertion protein ErpA [Phototrophicus methaneseepsis]QPC81225.1 iron-sulfur cluster insertion protein ErpA [Phototrophicus methaneseepsis]